MSLLLALNLLGYCSAEVWLLLVQEQKGVEHLLGLLVHQNIDIVSDVVEVFEDLTDADVVEDSVSQALQCWHQKVVTLLLLLQCLLHALTALIQCLLCLHGDTARCPVGWLSRVPAPKDTL